MPDFNLKAFQAEAASTIVQRYAFFANHPYRPSKGPKPRPFFQALSALTGAGKTPILAQAVTLMRSHFASEPIVFWMSKAKPVVAQTYVNFSAGGKYSEIVEGFRVINISQLTPHHIEDSATPLMIMATTGLFNNKDQSEGALNVYKKDADLFGNSSPWERLISRVSNGKRRPLLIVYDEGHNLSEQQTDILSELEPDAYLLASATLKLPNNFHKGVIQPIKLWVEESGDDHEHFEKLKSIDSDGQPNAQLFVTTAVSSEKVVSAELVKKAIQFDGTTGAMEKSLDDLHKRLSSIEAEINARGLGFSPKAIYVCKTNIADDGEKDDHSKPFLLRKAPPIRIWRYLVEEKGISPEDIAIYANLAFMDGNKPDEVNLFSKGEKDFEDFQAGDFKHIIFNLSLQEGWDDPGCYLAYIDKSMGSSIQVEQIIGRVLRQYGAKHYDNALLNSAHFFLRVDNQSVFTASINAVKEKLRAEGAPIEIVDNFGGAGGAVDDLHLKDGLEVALHQVHVDASEACSRIAEIVGDFPTFTENTPDTQGQAHTATQTVDLESLNKDSSLEWMQGGNTNPVRLRWLVNTALRARSTRALAVTDLKHPKFDCRVQIHSAAERYAEKLAAEIVDAYYSNSELAYESGAPFQFGAIRVPRNGTTYVNSIYEKYSGLNKFEAPFADSLDKAGFPWHRNSSSGGFHIPLLTEGDAGSFYPDFLVWKSGLVYCLDTKGGHLLSDAVARKLFDIQEDGRSKVLVRFITEGKQTELRGKCLKGGYTVWKMKSGTPTPIHVADLDKAVKECLK
ncbi:DEAD/DEAH box helicase family protein [Pseudomonas juntendi]|uniref:DEAD/DEAH box helicase family protein n=1 Tax=Pseudomonas juntendi TaxID=2666183 RepID=UPI001379D171|nr:DEAD/DEAH box helicase family protein [Pseudomonas juntendi]